MSSHPFPLQALQSTKAFYNGGIMSNIMEGSPNISSMHPILSWQTPKLYFGKLLQLLGYQTVVVETAIQRFIESSLDKEKASLGSILNGIRDTLADMNLIDAFDCTVSATMIAADLASLQQRDQYALGSLFEKTESGLRFIGCEENLEGNDRFVTNDDRLFLLNALKDFSQRQAYEVYSYIKTEHWQQLGIGDKLSRDVYLAGDLNFDLLPVEE